MGSLRFRSARVIAGSLALLVVTSGCQLLQSASRFASAPGSVREPFWCDTTPGVALSASDCQALSAQLDFGLAFAHGHFRASSATADGATSAPYVTGVGAAFRFGGPRTQFDFRRPDTLLYDGSGANAQVAGIEWNVKTSSAPSGFTGANDAWTAIGSGVWRLRVWLLRPFQNERNVFAGSHPCLASGGPVYDVTAGCYTVTHPNPFEILVSNDDGYDAAGIDAAVEALRALPIEVHITVSAPATNQSGSGGKTSPPPLTATARTTASGYPAWAVDGYPADSVLYALNTLHANPDLLVSGINDGQNIGPLIAISGTVGAARVGGRAEIPAVAVSQGLGSPPDFPPDFPHGARALVRWVNRFLLGRVGTTSHSVTNINIPTCTAGSIRGTAEVPAATAFNGRPFNPSNCLSTVTTFADDIDAFINGYISVSSIGVGP
jgi:5'-nucleotidase